MPLLRSAALQVPSIRRLLEHRDRLLTELSAEQAARRALEEQAEATRQHHLADLDAERAARRALEERAATTRHDHLAEFEAERVARQALEQDTAGLREARDQNRLFITEYAYFPAARPIEATAGGRQIAALFRREEPAIAATIAGIARHAENLARIPRQEDGPLRPHWENDWFPPFDGAALYGLIAETRPRRYVEVGSGHSTRFARQAVADFGLPTRIVSIDPHPHTAVAGLCDETIVCRMEDMPADFWAGLAPDDVVFIDNRHRSFPGSDVTVFFAEVMPALPPGVIYGIHDIFLPHDYPTDWNGRFYNEQYLLLAWLLGGGGGDGVLLPVNWAATQPHLHGLLSSLWSHAALFEQAGTGGGAYWARRGTVAA